MINNTENMLFQHISDANYDQVQSILSQQPQLMECTKGSAKLTPLQYLTVLLGDERYDTQVYNQHKRIGMLLILKYNAALEQLPSCDDDSMNIHATTFLHCLVAHHSMHNSNEAEIIALLRRKPEWVNIQSNNKIKPLEALFFSKRFIMEHGNEMQRSESIQSLKRIGILLAKHNATLTHSWDYIPSLIHFLISHMSDNSDTNDIIDLLEYNTFLLNAKDHHGFYEGRSRAKETLLHAVARSKNDHGLGQYLLTKAEVAHELNAKNSQDQTALALALKNQNINLIQLLLEQRNLAISDQERQLITFKLENKKIYTDPEDKSVLIPNDLRTSINKLEAYSQSLRSKNTEKASAAIGLAQALKDEAIRFFDDLEDNNFDEFRTNFSNLLHSKDAEMSQYRLNWNTIIWNIVIALTGIGILFIGTKLVYSQITEKRPLFFFQKSTTSSEDLVNEIQGQAEDPSLCVSPVVTCA